MIRNAYAAHPEGAEGWYRDFGATYRNPHEPGVKEAVASILPHLDPGMILDLACGSGEVTLALRDLGVPAEHIVGTDPYTGAAYRERTGTTPEAHSFGDIARGALDDRSFSAVICSCALHLCEADVLPAVCLRLGRIARNLAVITPHKRPEIRPAWGWSLAHEEYLTERRLRIRLYTAFLGS